MSFISLSHKKSTCISSLIKKGALSALGCSFILATGCSKEVHAPLPGEYGERLVSNLDVPADIIAHLNSTKMPNPTGYTPPIEVTFKANDDRNPYQFVIVAKGTALENGKVKLIWETGTMGANKNSYRSSIYSNKDTEEHDAGESVLLVIPSQPSQIVSMVKNGEFKTRINLKTRENFEFTNIELQVWEGEGSIKDWSDYLLPFMLFVALMGMAYGIYTKIVERVI